jgi:RNA polymerase sigma-70 factor (ECF subfamily)
METQDSGSDVWEARIVESRLGNKQLQGEILETFRNYLTLLARIQLRGQLQSKTSESDVVQQTFVSAIQAFAEFRGTTRDEFAAWLRKILASRVASQFRRYMATAGRQVDLERSIQQEIDRSARRIDPALLDGDRSPGEKVADQEQSIYLADALERLPDLYRDVIVARTFEDLTFPQIAQRMNRSEDSVQKLWWRGLLELRKCLKSLEE